MKRQEVSVDYWAMLKSMFTYGIMTGLGWVMLRLFHAVFMLPRRLRSQQNDMQNSLKELQKRFPDLNLTEEDLKNAEKELDELIKEDKKSEENTDEEKKEK
ncbi:unnamed protein product [Pieris macdunnoughi]|uniref:Uncharacterized protein n=1 Tax=Pieris macdunnoughi TaxID=345717 RepID=A0A821Q325_9NEOP|nr:unnamed protein product [Pieris macdunnoughi]